MTLRDLQSRWRAAILIALLATLGPVLFFAQAGGGWSAPANLSQSSADTKAADMVIDSSGRIHVAWSEGGEIWHRFDAGAGWSAPQRVASGTSPSLAADTSGHLHMAFANRFADKDDIYYVSWTAAGWSLPVNLSETTEDSFSPAIAFAANGGLAVVWSEQAAASQIIYLARSADGAHWSSAPVPQAQGTLPVVAFDAAGNPLVAWQDPLDIGLPLEIFASQWTGSQWTLPVAMSDSLLANSLFPSLAAGPGGVYLAWQEADPAGEAVYLSRLTDGSWSLPQKRSGDGQAFAPQVTLDALGNGHLAWAAGEAVQYRSWAILTDDWQPIEEVALAQPRLAGIRLAVLAAPHLIWLADASANNRDLYHSAWATAQPSPTPSRTPTLTSTATRTLTATRSATATRTPTSARSPTNTRTPTAPAVPSRAIFLPLLLRASR